MKYYINIVATSRFDGDFNATNKAREDVEKTLLDSGYVEIKLYWKTYSPGDSQFHRFCNRMMRALSLQIQARKKSHKMSMSDSVFFQYPDNSKCLDSIVKPFKHKGVKIEYIVHDIPSIRYGHKLSKEDKKLLNLADILYVHTDSMKSLLKSNGITSQMKVITLFDYYTNDPYSNIISFKSIAFAGNLLKSKFLHRWIEANNVVKWQLFLYGKNHDFDLSKSNNVNYKCSFKPDHVGVIEAGWGLVWDGDDYNTCSGFLGEYLRYNSSHKVSLYLTCGIPVICWIHSALASWVREQNVGITIESMLQIDDTLQSISIEDYMIIKKNCMVISERLRKGDFLKQQLSI